MGSIYGIIAALLNAGTIEAMPASLFLQWIKPEGNDKKEKNIKKVAKGKSNSNAKTA